MQFVVCNKMLHECILLEDIESVSEAHVAREL